MAYLTGTISVGRCWLQNEQEREAGGEGREAGRDFAAKRVVGVCSSGKQSNFPRATQLVRGKNRFRTRPGHQQRPSLCPAHNRRGKQPSSSTTAP